MDKWPGAGRPLRKLLCILKLSNSRKSAICWPGSRTELGRTGRAGSSFGIKGQVFCQKNLKPGLTPSQEMCYIIEETIEREGKVPFFMILIPLKLLLIILVIQHLLQ